MHQRSPASPSVQSPATHTLQPSAAKAMDAPCPSTKKGKGKRGQTRCKWPDSTTNILLNLCIERVNLGGGTSKSLTEDSWNYIEAKFQQLTGLRYTQEQMDNHLKQMRQEYSQASTLMNWTGTTTNMTTGMIEQDDNWWALRVAERESYARFRFADMRKYMGKWREFFGARYNTDTYCATATAFFLHGNHGEEATSDGQGTQVHGNFATPIQEGRGDTLPKPQRSSGSGKRKSETSGGSGKRGKSDGPEMSYSQSKILSVGERMVDEMANRRVLEQAKAAATTVPSLRECMNEVLASGVIDCDSQEYHRALNFLRSSENRDAYSFGADVHSRVGYLLHCLNDPNQGSGK